jgi:hypothetical protein
LPDKKSAKVTPPKYGKPADRSKSKPPAVQFIAEIILQGGHMAELKRILLVEDNLNEPPPGSISKS